jgi:hypothetical protein
MWHRDLGERTLGYQRQRRGNLSRSAPADPADLGAEGDGQHQQRERGDVHQPSVTSKAQKPSEVCGAPSAP